MEPQEKQNAEPGGRAYEKPTLRKIELVAEEVLGIGCKLNTSDTRGRNKYCGNASCNAANSTAS
ncbi:MAG: hypothetical protein M1337_00775 [Actinobacteria bacterium]|nr:hypothetical protein [Actinomycetota bacterium]